MARGAPNKLKAGVRGCELPIGLGVMGWSFQLKRLYPQGEIWGNVDQAIAPAQDLH
jgi:hypothetical protein